jgi:hypothetical protein
MLRKIIKSVTILFVLLVAFLIVGHIDKEESKLEKLNIYRGNIADYHVIIEETMRDGVQMMSVNLELINEKETTSKPLLITGRDNSGKDQFEEIFIREKERNGYNFTRSRDGWTWNPCPGDKDKTPPFTFKQISWAQEELRIAMINVRNNEHLYSAF